MEWVGAASPLSVTFAESPTSIAVQIGVSRPPRAKNAATAATRDEALRATLASMPGLSSRAIAKRLTDLGVEAPRGGAWSQKTVLRMMARLGLAA